jgi:hypothetical protein
MKSTTILALCFLGMLMTVNASESEHSVDELYQVATQVAGIFKTEMARLKTPINWNATLDILLGVGAGFMEGFFEAKGNKNGKYCFANIKNITAIIAFAQWTFQHLEKEPVKLTRQLLVLGVMVLNVTIEEWIYCKGLMDLYTAVINTAICALRCRQQYYNWFSSRALTRTYDYFYYIKESAREFVNKNYHLAGIWLAYTFDTLLFVYGGCYYSPTNTCTEIKITTGLN